MKRQHTFQLSGTAALLTCIATLWAISASEGVSLAKDAPPRKPAPSNTDDASGATETLSPGRESAGPDSESARKLLEMLRTKLPQDPKKLSELARARGNAARAELVFGRRIAVLQAREARLEQQRVELRQRADQATQERTQLRAQLDQEMDEIRQQFQDDKSQCEHQLIELITSYRPRLQQLKEQAEECAKLSAQTDARLGTIRRDVLATQQQRRLAAQGKPTKPSSVLLADLEPDDLDVSVQPNTATAAAGKSQMSVEELLKNID